MLEQFGIERERFRLEWVSASEGTKFRQVCNEFTERIRALGPLNFNGNGGGLHERR
jgi:F420-non-reducing hydrogenase iron-sulfur subunit